MTEHQVYRGWCSYCRAWREAPLDLHGQVLGQGRLGVGIASVVAHLRTVVQAPIRMIQAVLLELYGLHVSVGVLVDLLRHVAQAGQPAVADLRAEARASPALYADETGWQENGRNGYIWSLATKRVRYFEYHHSRTGAVVRELLGSSSFEGVLESDFYAAYNEYAGLHQRCWVHLLRDIHHLKEQHPTNEALLGWAAAIKNIYQCACAERGPDPAGPRAAQERLLLGGGPGGDGGPSLNDPGVSNGDPQASQKCALVVVAAPQWSKTSIVSFYALAPGWFSWRARIHVVQRGGTLLGVSPLP